MTTTMIPTINKSTRLAGAARLAGAVLMGALSLSSCGLRYYSATVSGYVKESKPDANGAVAGINGAEVLVYLEDPGLNAAALPSIRTSSMTSANNDGYWSHKVMWTTTDPAFADEGDSGELWIKVMRKGYFPQVVKVPGILSDSSNVVPTIELVKIVTTELRGKVVNEKGAGVNGVNVVLDLMTTVDEKADYTATTATVNGEVGIFNFSDITWEDLDSKPTPAKAFSPRAILDGTATELVKIYVDDPAWYSDANSADERYKDAQVPFTITSGDAIVDIVSTPVVVSSSTFTALLVKGRVADKAGAGMNKVTVALQFPVSGAAAATVTTAQVGGVDGWFVFDKTQATWTNNRPTHSDAATGTQGTKHDDVTVARIYLNDGNYYSTNDSDKPLEVSVTSDSSLDLSSLATPLAIVAGDATFTTASVKGQVFLKGGSVGVNSVTVALALASNNQNPLTTQTATVGSDGTFEFKNVTWTDTKPELDANDHDTEQARLYIQDNNFNSETVQASPWIVTLTSKLDLDLTAAPATPLYVTKRNFNCPKVSGKVVNQSDGVTGIAGVTVVLHRMSDANTNNDLNTTSDKDGNFSFTNVTWADTRPDTAATDTEDIKLSAQSADYRTTAALEVQSLQSDVAAPATGSWQIVAARQTGWSYQVNLTGTCKYRADSLDPSKDVTLSGVTVTIQYTTTAPANYAGNLVTNAESLVVNTAANGNYTATITWSRDAAYSPPADAAANGGDKLNVLVTFSDPQYTFDTVLTKDLLSWSQNNIVNGLTTTVLP